jgi:nicotinamide mononucleotide transporter
MIQLFGEQITFVELTGTVFGILGVWLTVRENILCFPTGIVNVALYAWLFYKSHLYADALLQIIYILLLIYGWYVWIRKKNYSELHVTKSSGNLLLFLFILCVISTIGIGTFFRYKTDASLPYVDSFTTALSLVAQWMIAKKKIENWLVWIVADVIYVGMYVYKHLYFTSFLYLIFIILAVTGLQQWKKDLQTISSVN